MNNAKSILTRRVALHCAVGGASAALFPLTPRAMAAERPPIRFLVVTDTHLGYRDQESATQQWRRTAEELSHAKGEFVLHLGDLVDGGREVHYPTYVEIRKAIGKAVHEIPGNHDPAELFERHIRKPIDTVIDHDWLRVLLLNNARPESHDGFLSGEQLAWMDARCEEARKQDRFVIIAMHVPVHENRHPDRGWYVKKEHGHAEFYELAKRHAGRLLAVLHGHFHNGLRGWTDHAPLHEISFPSALYNQDRRLEEQQAPGYNPTEFRPGFSLVEVAPTGLRVEFKPLGQDVAFKKALQREGIDR